MDEILGLFFRITNSVILVKYYAAFLSPKSEKLSRNVVFAGFGMAYFIIQYLAYFFSISFLTAVPVHITSFIISCTLYLFVFLSSFTFFKKSLGMQIYLLCSFFVIQEISYFISLCIYNLIGKTGYITADFLLGRDVLTSVESSISLQNAFSGAALFMHLISYPVVYLLSIQSISRSFSHKNQSFSLIELLYLILPCLSGFALIFIMRAISYTPDSNSHLGGYAGVPYAEFLMLLAGIIFLVSLISAVKLFQKLAELSIQKSERIILQKQTQQLHEQIKGINDIYTEIRGVRHDIKNHVSNIRLLIKATDEGNHSIKNELSEYLNQFGEVLDKFEFVFQTGNSISDVIIHQKYIEAVKNGIEFSADFLYPAQLDLDAYDLAVILNNALENAIEACNGIAQADRFIRLYSYIKGEMFFIEIENSFTGQITINEHSDLPVSSKTDMEQHGIGLSNIRRCAEKYYGDLNIQIRNEESYSIFHLIIMLQSRA